MTNNTEPASTFSLSSISKSI
jgi:hypothetical protein